jgi:hypothetical protein
MRYLFLIAFLLVSSIAYCQTVGNSTTNKTYDTMPVGSAIWVTSTTFKTFINDTKYKIDSLISPQPYTKVFTNADSVVILKSEHLVNTILNVVVKDTRKIPVYVQTKIDPNGKVVVKFHRKKTGTLFIY